VHSLLKALSRSFGVRWREIALAGVERSGRSFDQTVPVTLRESVDRDRVPDVTTPDRAVADDEDSSATNSVHATHLA